MRLFNAEGGLAIYIEINLHWNPTGDPLTAICILPKKEETYLRRFSDTAKCTQATADNRGQIDLPPGA